MLNQINKLTEKSREKSIFFEEYIKWEKYEQIDKNNWFLDEKLISIYGSKIYTSLSLEQKKKLSLLELSNNLYLYSYGESIMCIFMSKFLLNYKIGTPYYNFILRELIEEYRHQDMFERVIKKLGNTNLIISNFWKIIGKLTTLGSTNYFFILQVSLEIISGDFGKKNIENKNIHPLVIDICKIHEIEESRHIIFAKLYLDKNFKNANIFSRTIVGYFLYLNLFFINKHYFSIQNYKDIGIIDYKKAYKYAKNNWKKNKFKNLQSEEGKYFLERYKLITPLNKWLFNKLIKY